MEYIFLYAFTVSFSEQICGHTISYGYILRRYDKNGAYEDVQAK